MEVTNPKASDFDCLKELLCEEKSLSTDTVGKYVSAAKGFYKLKEGRQQMTMDIEESGAAAIIEPETQPSPEQATSCAEPEIEATHDAETEALYG